MIPDETQHFEKQPTGMAAVGSQLAGVSIRGWLALAVVLTACYMVVAQVKIEEPFYSALLIVIGAMFGQTNAKPR